MNREGEPPIDFQQSRKKLKDQGLLGLSGPDRLMKYLGLLPEAKYDIEEALFNELPLDVITFILERHQDGSKENLCRKNSLTRKRAQHPQIRLVGKNPPR